jgi:hypothetical protein
VVDCEYSVISRPLLRMQGTTNQNLAILAPALVMLSSLLGSYSPSPSVASSHAHSGRRSKRVKSSGLGGMNPANSADLRLKPPTDLNVPKSVPRSIPNLVVWDSVKLSSQIAASGAGIVETNYIFTITLHNQYSSWLALYDQYCIVQASIEFDSLTPPGQTYSSPVLYTAIDFDSAQAITNLSAIGDFGSCEVIVMAPEKRHLRSVKPCCKVSTQTSGTSVMNAGVTRQWVDSAASQVQHYGIRTLTQFYGAGSISVVQTIYYAFRNQI